MTPELAERIERVRLAFGDVCFACGRHNDVGLHLDGFEWDGTAVTAEFDPRTEYRGAGDVLHGGIAATALDEISVWAGILGESVLTVTGKLDLRFRRPITVDDHVTARGQVDDRRGRRLVISAALEVAGATAVESSGLFLVSREMHEL
ncbi:MAG TPA: PaaI family thioesterase [Acidimicrobiia bacterium]|nr:PaaI family thioesterase [Acidimicrobiia bacterium]